MVQFGYTIFYVEDVVKTLAFYEKAFSLKRKFLTPDNSYGELNTGATTLSFASHTLAKSNLKEGFTKSSLEKKPFAMEIGLTTEDVEGAVKQAIKAGGKLVEKPKKKPWGQVVAYIRDPNGFLLEICTPIN